MRPRHTPAGHEARGGGGSNGEPTSRVGEGFVPRSGVIVISVSLVALTAVTLYR